MTKNELLERAKPILFNTEMVRAIQNNLKTVTRRVVKPQPDSVNDIIYKNLEYDKWFISPDDSDDSETEVKLPYKVGDILYVRETYCAFDSDHIINGVKYAYKANSTSESERARKEFGYKWKPSIHMPKEAARIFLRVTGIRVERLQDISDKDLTQDFDLDVALEAWGKEESCRMVWNRTVKKSGLTKYGWNANPWVWVIEFERVEVS